MRRSVAADVIGAGNRSQRTDTIPVYFPVYTRSIEIEYCLLQNGIEECLFT